MRSRSADRRPGRRGRLGRGRAPFRRRAARRRERVDALLRATARWSRSSTGQPGADRSARARARAARGHALSVDRRRSSRPRSASTPTSRATSSSARAAARSTTSTSTASRRGPTCSARSASGSPRRCRSVEPDAVRLAGPELGAVALAAAASLASGLPFLIVRKEAKGYGTGEPARRAPSRRASCVVPRRGRRHLGRGRSRGRRGAPRGGARGQDGGLRRRPRGRRSRRSRATSVCAAAALPGRRSSSKPGKVPQSRMVERKARKLLGSFDRDPAPPGRRRT